MTALRTTTTTSATTATTAADEVHISAFDASLKGWIRRNVDIRQFDGLLDSDEGRIEAGRMLYSRYGSDDNLRRYLGDIGDDEPKQSIARVLAAIYAEDTL